MSQPHPRLSQKQAARALLGGVGLVQEKWDIGWCPDGALLPGAESQCVTHRVQGEGLKQFMSSVGGQPGSVGKPGQPGCCSWLVESPSRTPRSCISHEPGGPFSTVPWEAELPALLLSPKTG